MMDGKTEHRELPHPVAHPDQHGSIPMTDDRKPDRCVRHDCRRALAESRAKLMEVQELLFAELSRNERLEERAEKLAERWEKIADEHGVRTFTGSDHLIFANELRAALNLEPTP